MKKLYINSTKIKCNKPEMEGPHIIPWFDDTAGGEAGNKRFLKILWQIHMKNA